METELNLIERIKEFKSYLQRSNNIKIGEFNENNMDIIDIKCPISYKENAQFVQQVFFNNGSFRKLDNKTIDYLVTYNNKYNVIVTIKKYKHNDDENNINTNNNRGIKNSIIISNTLIHKTQHILIPLLCFDTELTNFINLFKNDPELYNIINEKISSKEIKNIFLVEVKECFNDGNFLHNIENIDYKIVLFQLLYTLAQIQIKYPNFQHNFLIPRNIFVYQYDNNKQSIYNINNNHYEFETNIDIKITNFDKSILDTEKPDKSSDVLMFFSKLLKQINDIHNSNLNETKLFLHKIIKKIKNKENITPIQILNDEYFDSLLHNNSETETEYETNSETETDSDIEQVGGVFDKNKQHKKKKYYTAEERAKYNEEKKKKFGDDYDPNFNKNLYTRKNGPVSTEIPNINEENPFVPNYENDFSQKQQEEQKNKEKQEWKDKQNKERENKKKLHTPFDKREVVEREPQELDNPFISNESIEINKKINQEKKGKTKYNTIDTGKIQPYQPKLYDETSETRDERIHHKRNKHAVKPYNVNKDTKKKDNSLKPYTPKQYDSDVKVETDYESDSATETGYESEFDIKNKEYRSKYNHGPYKSKEFRKKTYKSKDNIYNPNKKDFDKFNKKKSNRLYEPKNLNDTEFKDKNYLSDDIYKLQDLDKEDKTQDMIDYYYHPYQAHALHPNYMLMNKLNTGFSLNNPNIKVPMQNIYNIQLTNTTRDLEFLEKVYEDMYPIDFKNFDYKTVHERNQLLQYIRNRFLTHGDGEEMSLVAGAPKSYLQRLMLIEVAPYKNEMIYNTKDIKSKYASLPHNFINYTAAGPIRYDRNNLSVKLAADKLIGFNVRQYGLSIGALLSNQINRTTNHLYFDVWRDITYYQHIKQNITDRKVSPNFINMIMYTLDKTINFDYDKLNNIIDDKNVSSSSLKTKNPGLLFFKEMKENKKNEMDEYVSVIKLFVIPTLYSKNISSKTKEYIANMFVKMQSLQNNGYNLTVIDELRDIIYYLINEIKSSTTLTLTSDDNDMLNGLVNLYDKYVNNLRSNKILELSNYIDSIHKNKTYLDAEKIINNTNKVNQEHKELFLNTLETIDKLAVKPSISLNEQSGVSLIALTEAPTYSFEEWVTPKDNKMGEKYTQITTGYHAPEVMKSIIFQMVYTFVVLYQSGLYFPDISLNNFFIKELYYKDTPSSHWTFVVNGIEYYIPNYGFLLLFDSTYGDRKTDDKYIKSPTGSETKHTIYFRDDTKIPPSPPSDKEYEYTEKTYPTNNYYKILSKDKKIYPEKTNLSDDDYKNDFINKMKEFFSLNNFTTGFMTNALYDNDLRNLIINIEKFLKEITPAVPPAVTKDLTSIFSKVFSDYVNDRVGTTLTKNEYETMYSPIRDDNYKKGELLIYMERYNVYEWVIYVDNDSSSRNQVKVINKKGENKEINKNRLYRKRVKLEVKQNNPIMAMDKCLERYNLDNLVS